MKWNWQLSDWPNFSYSRDAIVAFEARFLQESGMMLGAFKHLDASEKQSLTIQLISEEALKTSEIEGESLNRESLQSSIQRQFGLHADKRSVTLGEQGIAEMMVNLYETYDEPLSEEMLFRWHGQLMQGRRDLQQVESYRVHADAMQVVSGVIHDPKVHFEAPPSDRIPAEMKGFIAWFNETAPKGKRALPAITRASITHLYFVAIHPFEDGNGRIGRALSEKALAQCLGQPSLITLAHGIERRKKEYYSPLHGFRFGSRKSLLPIMLPGGAGAAMSPRVVVI